MNLARRIALWIVAIAPWAYGCTRPSVLPWFSAALLVCLAVWVGGLIQRRRGPVVPKVLLALVICLGVQGWLLTVNAGYRYDRNTLRFTEIKPWLATWLPQAIDAADAFPMMLRMSGLLGCVLLAADAARLPGWRRQLFWTVTGSGTLLAAYGLIQKFSPVPLLFWEQEDLGHNLFATYYYHGNAGAFMNLVLPFAFAAAVEGFTSRQSPGRRALGVVALFLNLAAAIAIASKAAQMVSGFLLVLSLWLYRREILLAVGIRRFSPSRWAAASGLAALCVVALFLSADAAQKRWAFLPQLLNSENPRLLAYQGCLRILPDAGWWGIGPGNFAIDFPHYTHGLPDAIKGIWNHAHQDYLQTVIEWGWVGASVWTAVFLGAFWQGRKWLRRPAAVNTSRAEDGMVYRSALLAQLGVALHATVDFPLQTASIQLYAMVLMGVLWQVSGGKKIGSRVKTCRERPVYAEAAVAGSMVGMEEMRPRGNPPTPADRPASPEGGKTHESPE